MGDTVPFEAAEAWGAKVLAPLLAMEMAPRTLINVNFPALPAEQIKGVRVVRQGFHDYSRGSIVEGVDPRGYTYYWFGLHGIEQSLAHDSDRSEEHTSELQSLMRISYAVFCLKKKTQKKHTKTT